MLWIVGTGELTGFYQATSCVQPQGDDNSSDIIKAGGDEEEAGKQPSFYEQKLKNDYRLPYIKDILSDKKDQER